MDGKNFFFTIIVVTLMCSLTYWSANEKWNSKTQISLSDLIKQIKECEKNLPRSQYCVGEVKIIIKDKEQ